MSSVKPSGDLMIDWGHPLARGLVECYAFVNNSIRDEVTKEVGILGSGADIKRGVYTSELNNNDTSVLVTRPLPFNTFDGVSVISGYSQKLSILNNYPQVYSSGSTNQTLTDCHLTINEDNNEYSGGIGGVTVSVSSSDNVKNTKYVTHAVSSDLTSVQLTVYEDSTKLYGSSSSLPVLTGLLSENLIGQLYRWGDRTFTGDIKYVYIYSRALSPTEIASLHDNPYQFLIPRRSIQSQAYAALFQACPYVTLVTPPTKGLLTLEENGDYTYEYTGALDSDTDSFTYKLTTPYGDDTAVVNLTITGGGGQTIHGLLSDSIGSGVTLSTPAITQIHNLSPTQIESSGSVSQPSLDNATTTYDLFANNIGSVTSVTEPSIKQNHSLASEDLISTSTVTSPALGTVHVLSSIGVSASSDVSSPNIAQTHKLLSDSVSNNAQVSVPVLRQIYSLTANGIVSGSSVSTPGLAGLTLESLNLRITELEAEVSILTDEILVKMDEIKAKTDAMTFTNANEVDVNVKSNNDSPVYGSGTSTDKWRGEP